MCSTVLMRKTREGGKSHDLATDLGLAIHFTVNPSRIEKRKANLNAFLDSDINEAEYTAPKNTLVSSMESFQQIVFCQNLDID